ncbi:superinfection exclusion B family protein [Bacillus velezensis]|uniref:superinfection exclusion B family protein n=1 Tax=Bacillus velezensis TaxID=492670 RepID=UPI000F038728|nr:superinfection exclusion B family protein [Bacillus velezensis]
MSEQNEKSPSWVGDIIKLSPKYLLGLAAFSGIGLWLGNVELGKTLGIKDAINNYKLYLGLVFLASTSFILSHLIWWISLGIKRVFDQKTRYKLQKDRLRNLNRREKQILSPYIFDNVRSMELSITDGTTKELEHLMIIYRSSDISSRGHYFAYNLQPWAREYLTKNKHLLHEPIDHVL